MGGFQLYTGMGAYPVLDRAEILWNEINECRLHNLILVPPYPEDPNLVMNMYIIHKNIFLFLSILY